MGLGFRQSLGGSINGGERDEEGVRWKGLGFGSSIEIYRGSGGGSS